MCTGVTGSQRDLPCKFETCLVHLFEIRWRFTNLCFNRLGVPFNTRWHRTATNQLNLNIIEKLKMSIQTTVLPSGTTIIEVDGVVHSFPTEADANAAVAVIENGAEFLAQANAYCAFKGLTGKNAVGKVNVITDFLAYTAAGSPTVEVVADEVVAATGDEAVDPAKVEF